MEEKNKLKGHPTVAGLKLGMLLQFGGMGPISLLIFQLAAVLSLSDVMMGIVAVTLADTIYILIALLGIMGIIKQVKGTSSIFRKINGAIIVYLGMSFALMSLTDRVSYLDIYDWNGKSVFWGVFVLTMLNPVTIICYTGVFNARVMDLKMSNKALWQFAFGTLVTTPVFMCLVAIIGAMGGKFLPDGIINAMNLVVGLLLIFWGLKYISPQLAEKIKIKKAKTSIHIKNKTSK